MRLWRDHGKLLIAKLGKLEPPVWRLGGGTLLAKAWQHRLSFDLDITIPTGGSRRTEQAVLDAIETELRKRRLDVAYDPAERLLRAKTGVVDDYGNESGIDIWVHDPGLPGSPGPETISGTPVNRLSVAQIIHGKLQRDQMGLVRDAYDINYAHRFAPAALETAANSLTPEHVRRAEIPNPQRVRGHRAVGDTDRTPDTRSPSPKPSSGSSNYGTSGTGGSTPPAR